jgi:hypothetical protein
MPFSNLSVAAIAVALGFVTGWLAHARLGAKVVMLDTNDLQKKTQEVLKVADALDQLGIDKIDYTLGAIGSWLLSINIRGKERAAVLDFTRRHIESILHPEPAPVAHHDGLIVAPQEMVSPTTKFPVIPFSGQFNMTPPVVPLVAMPPIPPGTPLI